MENVVKMAKKKRKLSAYNIFIKRQVKAGKSFTQAARAWKGGTTRKTKRKVKRVSHRKQPKRSGFRMARRRKTSRRTTARGLMAGLFKPKGLLAGVLVGVGTAAVANKLVGQQVPYQDVVAGFVTGGLPGAAGAYAVRMFLQGNGGGIAYY